MDAVATAKDTLEGVKDSLVKPKTAAREHFWVFLAVVLFLAAVAFVVIENKNPGAIRRFVQRTFGRIPLLGKQVMVFALGALALLTSSSAQAAMSHASSSNSGGWLGTLLGALGALALGAMVSSPRRRYIPLTSGASGSEVTTSPDTSPTKVPWQVKNLPFQTGKYQWYCEGFIVKHTVTLTATDSDTFIPGPMIAANVLQSFELRSQNKLGTLWSQSETSGPRLELIDGKIAEGYEDRGRKPSGVIPAVAEGSRTAVREVWHWIPFTQKNFENPAHFAPHCALLEEAMLDIFVNSDSVFQGLDDGSDNVIFTNSVMSVIAVCVAETEIRLHTPVKWGAYDAQGQGTNIRLKLLQSGGKNTLNGVLDKMGIVSLYAMSNVWGLPGSITWDALVGGRVQADFLGLSSLEFPDALVEYHLSQIGLQGGNVQRDSTVDDSFAVADRYHWPVKTKLGAEQAASVSDTVEHLLNAQLLYYPFVMPGKGAARLSKVSEWDGTNEIVFGFSQSQNQQTFQFGTLEVGTWDPQWMKEALRVIVGTTEAAKYYWAPKPDDHQKRGIGGKFPIDGSKLKYFPWVAHPINPKAR